MPKPNKRGAICRYCGRRFATQYQAWRHIQQAHPDGK